MPRRRQKYTLRQLTHRRIVAELAAMNIQEVREACSLVFRSRQIDRFAQDGNRGCSDQALLRSRRSKRAASMILESRGFSGCSVAASDIAQPCAAARRPPPRSERARAAGEHPRESSIDRTAAYPCLRSAEPAACVGTFLQFGRRQRRSAPSCVPAGFEFAQPHWELGTNSDHRFDRATRCRRQLRVLSRPGARVRALITSC